MFNLQQRRWDLFVDWFDWFNEQITKHDKICFEKELNEWWCLMIKEERCIKWCLIFNKEDEIYLLIDLIDSLANNEDFLSLNLLIDLILEQFTKILYHDSCNWVNFAYLMSNK